MYLHTFTLNILHPSRTVRSNYFNYIILQCIGGIKLNNKIIIKQIYCKYGKAQRLQVVTFLQSECDGGHFVLEPLARVTLHSKSGVRRYKTRSPVAELPCLNDLKYILKSAPSPNTIIVFLICMKWYAVWLLFATLQITHPSKWERRNNQFTD